MSPGVTLPVPQDEKVSPAPAAVSESQSAPPSALAPRDSRIPGGSAETSQKNCWMMLDDAGCLRQKLPETGHPVKHGTQFKWLVLEFPSPNALLKQPILLAPQCLTRLGNALINCSNQRTSKRCVAPQWMVGFTANTHVTNTWGYHSKIASVGTRWN